MLLVDEIGLGPGCAREWHLPLRGAVGLCGGRDIAAHVVWSAPNPMDMALCMLAWAARGLGFSPRGCATLKLWQSPYKNGAPDLSFFH